MGVIVAADLNEELDRTLQAWYRLKVGIANALAAVEALDSLTFSVADARADISVGNQILKAKLDSTGEKAAKDIRPLLTKIERHVQLRGGVASLDVFLSSLNPTSGTKWTGLQDYRLYDLYQFWKGSGVVPSVHNLYKEILQGATYTNALGKLLVGTGFTAGDTIDTTKYAGGFPYLLVSGFAGSAGTVTVTGTQYDPATRTATAGKTWTVSVTGNGSFALTGGGGTPAATDALIAAVSGISAAGSITASTLIYCEARKPTSRVDIAA